MKGIHIIAFALLAIGGLNWLLVGIWGWDISQWFGGQAATVSRVIYVLVGVAAVIEIVKHKVQCKHCAS